MKRTRIILPYLFSLAILTLSVHGAHAQTTDPNNYQLLQPIPSDVSSQSNITSVPVSGAGSFANYVNTIYKAAILVAGVLAVIMITLGGVEYMASDSPFSKGDGRAKIGNAIVGLLLLVSCYLILNTINPQLLNLNINISSTTTAVPSSSQTQTSNTTGTIGGGMGNPAATTPATTGSTDLYGDPNVS